RIDESQRRIFGPGRRARHRVPDPVAAATVGAAVQGVLEFGLVLLDREVFSTVPPYLLIASTALSGVTFSSIKNSAEVPFPSFQVSGAGTATRCRTGIYPCQAPHRGAGAGRTPLRRCHAACWPSGRRDRSPRTPGTTRPHRPSGPR